MSSPTFHPSSEKSRSPCQKFLLSSTHFSKKIQIISNLLEPQIQISNKFSRQLINVLFMGFDFLFSVKKGGPNPISNPVLSTLLEKAKELDVPKEIVERNIKRASEKGQEAYIEKLYEVENIAFSLDLAGSI